jgi:dipeptidyl aminopeptidase/acylaminoacyl peptidase
MRRHRRLLSIFLGCLSLVAATAAAQPAPSAATADLAYQTPPQPLADIIDRLPTPSVAVSPDQQWLLLLEQPSLPAIAELSEPELRLGGLRFKPGNNAPSRRRTESGYELLRIADGERRPFRGLPPEPRLEDVTFSPDGAHVAFTHTRADRVELWVAEVATGAARRLGDAALNLASGAEPVWLADSRALLCALVPSGRGAPPQPAAVPSGPVVQENLGTAAPARTFQDLLASPHDEALFEHYLESQLARVDLDGGVTPLGEPGLIWDYDASPDGSYLLVEILHRPFSYLRPAGSFPTRVEVWSAAGERVRQVVDLPLRENVPKDFGSVATGPRSFSWRADAPATVVWVEALDGGDAGREAEFRDRLFALAVPFGGEPRPWAKLVHRYAGILWARDDLALVSTWWWKTRNLRVSRLRPADLEAAPELIIDRSWEDRYGDPGEPLLTVNEYGRPVLLTGGDDGETLYLVGDGASEEGDRPFFDLYDLKSRSSERLFHSQAPYYERPIRLLDGDGRRLLTRRESVDEPPDYFVRDLEGGAPLRRLTSFPHPTPELRGLEKELIRYRRADGVPLTATLYLPPGYEPENGPLPTLVWAYPQEFKSADAAGQVSDSPYRFDRIGWYSSQLWLTRGYAVLDDPSMPIIGEGDDEPNDRFVEQLVSSAEAAVAELVRRGVSRPGQIAIGGHSYGAFMTANLLAHSDLFAAGVARSGAYNRTLTPFGFQSEERSVWEAPEVYFAMSPFLHAETIDEPLLLIHGAADNNPGTFPMQSERFYDALKGHGATARLVMLPHESHGYRARESVAHMLWETDRWLEKYVVDAAVVPTVEPSRAMAGSEPR